MPKTSLTHDHAMTRPTVRSDRATDYYITKTDNDTIKFALSLALALAGTAVDITAAAGGGTHTVSAPLTAYKQLLDVSLARLEQAEDSDRTGRFQ